MASRDSAFRLPQASDANILFGGISESSLTRERRRQILFISQALKSKRRPSSSSSFSSSEARQILTTSNQSYSTHILLLVVEATKSLAELQSSFKCITVALNIGRRINLDRTASVGQDFGEDSAEVVKNLTSPSELLRFDSARRDSTTRLLLFCGFSTLKLIT